MEEEQLSGQLEKASISPESDDSDESEGAVKKRSSKNKKDSTGKKSKNAKPTSKKKEKAMLKEKSKISASRKLFSDYYEKQYGEKRWKTLIEAMEKPTRHCCLVNKYAAREYLGTAIADILPRLKRVPFLQKVACLSLEDDHNVSAPFPHPSKDPVTTRMNYYLLDAASVLATEALDIQPNDCVLDMCAAPGQKSIAILQQLDLANNGRLTCNELSPDRRKRLRTVIHDYIPRNLQENVQLTSSNGTKFQSFDMNYFNKILVDAPCSSDRHLLHDSDELTKWTTNRSSGNSKRQYALLSTAVRIIKVNGLIVYTTCSISNLENDGVVEKILKKSKENIEVVKKEFPIGEPTKYGWIVLPDAGDRWGPLFFCILKRNAGIREKSRNSKEESSDSEDEDFDEEDEDD